MTIEKKSGRLILRNLVSLFCPPYIRFVWQLKRNLWSAYPEEIWSAYSVHLIIDLFDNWKEIWSAYSVHLSPESKSWNLFSVAKNTDLSFPLTSRRWKRTQKRETWTQNNKNKITRNYIVFLWNIQLFLNCFIKFKLILYCSFLPFR